MKNINKKSTLISGLCLILLTVLLSVSAAYAGNTWQVDKTRNSGLCNGDNRVCTSLKAAVAAAESGDKITINAKRYDAENDILIENKNLEIVGAGQPRIVSLGVGNGTMVDEESGTQIYAYNICPTCSELTLLGRVFRVKNSTVSISGMWIQGGSSGDGGAVLIESGGKVTFRNVKITGQTGSGASGGAIYNNGGTLNINNSYIIGISGSIHRADNRVGGSGGGLFNKGGKVTIADSTFQFCAIWGAGSGSMPGTTPNRRGFSAGNGGAVYNDAAGEVIIVRSDFINNEAGAGGAGGNGANLSIGAGFDGATGGNGGAIYNDGSMYISDSSLAFNAGGKGGSGGFSTTNPAVGAGGGFGGGIFNNGNLNLVNSTLSSNKAGDGGTGGSSDTANGDNGGPGGSGGGIYNSKTLEMTNVTVSANTIGAGGSGGTGGYISNGATGSGGDGGGVVNGYTATIEFINLVPKVTVVDGTSSAKNTIIAGNTTASGGKYPDVAGQFYSNGHNLIGVSFDDSNFRADGDQKGSSAAPLNAKLGVLGANGGRGSSVSYDLLPGSPAIDAGDDSVTGIPFELAYDQRGAGFTRKYGSHVDIGAIETFPPNTAPTASGQSVSINEDIAKTITLSSSDAENDALTYTITNPAHGTLSGTAPNLTYTPNADYNGSDSFTFKVNDGEFDSSVAKVTITVAAVNDVPTFTKGADPTVLEDAGEQTVSGFLSNISVGPADESAQLISFAVTNNSNFLLFTTAPIIDRNGNLIFTAKPDANGSSTISFQAQDSGTTSNGGVNTTAVQTFVINITPVNDAPGFTKGADQIVNEDAGAKSIANWATAISKGPANESAQTVNFEVTNNNNNLFSAQPTVSSAGVLTYTPASNASGTATVTLRIKDSGGTADGGVDASATQSFTVTVNAVNDAPTASNDKAAQNVQYSDAVQTINVGGTDVDSSSLTASVSYTKDGGSSQTGLPSGLTFSTPANCTAANVALVGAGTSCGWTISGRASVAPGTYVVTVTISDGAIQSSTGLTITVNREDARATYTGASFAATPTVSSGIATVTLAATIQDISAVSGNSDILPGDVRNATVKFVNRDSGAILCTATGVGLVNANDLTVGTATCNWAASIGNSESMSFTVGIVVEGFYTRNDAADNTVVTVSKPIPGVISGGGYLVLIDSSGQRAGDAGTKNNFGFNIKNDKNGPKGNINVIVRRMESDGILHTYQIKGNAMTSLAGDAKIAQNHPFPTATFNGKANIQDITFANDSQNPRVTSIDGGASLQVVMTDRGEPGSSDSIAVTLWDKNGGLWFASRWDTVKTVEQTLSGGNLQVR